MQVYHCDSISCSPWNFTTNDYWNKEHRWVGGKDLYCNEMMYSVRLLTLLVSARKLGVLFLIFTAKHKFSCGIHASLFAKYMIQCMFYVRFKSSSEVFCSLVI